jgi:hypothetical protein
LLSAGVPPGDWAALGDVEAIPEMETPHFVQKLALMAIVAPHFGHTVAMGAGVVAASQDEFESVRRLSC